VGDLLRQPLQVVFGIGIFYAQQYQKTLCNGACYLMINGATGF
jgi:hypothetical protein